MNIKRASIIAIAGIISVSVSISSAALYDIDLSPGAGLALNLGSTTYVQDHAIGLAAINAVGQPASTATGNEVGLGITYDDVSNTLTYDFAYGSAFGFQDLVGSYTVAHVHGPSAVNFPAVNTGGGVAFGLTHISSGTKSGRFTGVQVLSAAQEVDLFDNELYANVHSSAYGGGEIRAQLIAVPEPSTLVLFGLGSLLVLKARGRR